MLAEQTIAQEVRDIVFKSIQQVMEDSEIAPINLMMDMNLVKDLHFTSLMIAQLIMLVQEEIQIEPFTNQYAISDMITVSDYIYVYSQGK